MAEKKFCDMDSVERFEDLRGRVEKFSLLELPGQPQGMHMGTSYLVDDLWRELQKSQGHEQQAFIAGIAAVMNNMDVDEEQAWQQYRCQDETDFREARGILESKT